MSAISSSSQLPSLTLVCPFNNSWRYFIRLEQLNDAGVPAGNAPPPSSSPHDFYFRLCRHHCLKQFFLGGENQRSTDIQLIGRDPAIDKWVNYGDLIEPDNFKNPHSSSLSNFFDGIPNLVSLAPWIALFVKKCNSDEIKSAKGMLMHVVIVKLEYYYDEADAIARAERESMESARMVPASKSTIEGLKKELVIDCDPDEQCMICLDRIVMSGFEISCLPCSHLYHFSCIVHWLETSHFCPTCRYCFPC